MSQPDDEIEVKLEEIRPMPARLRIHMERHVKSRGTSHTGRQYFKSLFSIFMDFHHTTLLLGPIHSKFHQ